MAQRKCRSRYKRRCAAAKRFFKRVWQTTWCPPTNTSVGLCDIVLPLTTVINDVTAPDEAFFGSIAQSSADGIGASSYPPHTD